MWQEGGAHLENYPEGETLDDFIAREELAVSNFKRAIKLLKDRGQLALYNRKFTN